MTDDFISRRLLIKFTEAVKHSSHKYVQLVSGVRDFCGDPEF